MKHKVFFISLIALLVTAMDSGGILCQYYPHDYRTEIILGAPLSLDYPDGVAAQENLQLAVHEINDNGGITLGATRYPLRLIVADTNDLDPGVSGEQAIACIDDLVLNKHADLIVGGPIRSEIALSAMEEIHNLALAGHPVLAVWSAGFLSPAFGTTVAGNYDNYKYCFRLQGSSTELINDTVQILDAIAAAQNWSSPKAYIMVQDVAHAVSAGDALNNTLPGHNWTITGYVKVPSGTTAFEMPLLTANSTGAQVLIPWFDMPESQYLVNTWSTYQYKMLPVGFLVPTHDPEAWTVSGGKCAYVVNVYPRAGITGINAQAKDYIVLHLVNYGVEPGPTWVAPVCYQLPYILKDAIERAGSLDPNAVIAALEATDMVGVFGKVSFNATTHDIISSNDPSTGAITTWIQWVSGNRVAVWPAAVKAADVVLPPWGVNP